MGTQLIEGKRLTYFSVEPEQIVVIGLDTEDGNEHPLYDERVNEPEDSPELQSLARDMMVRGVLEPVTVRKNGSVMEVVYGRRRVRAARIANALFKKAGKRDRVFVPVAARKGSDIEMGLAMLSENEHRRGDTYMVKAAKAQHLTNLGASINEIMVALGCGEQSVRDYLKVADLSPKARRAVDDKRLSPSAAVKIAVLPREEQDAKLEEMLASGAAAVTADQAAHVMRREREKKNGKASSDEGAVAVPRKRTLRGAITLAQGDPKCQVDPGVILGLRIALGDLDPARVKGVKALFDAASAPKKPKEDA